MSTERRIKQAIKLALAINDVSFNSPNASLYELIKFFLKIKVDRGPFSGIFKKIYEAISDNPSVHDEFKLIVELANKVLRHSDAVKDFYVTVFQYIPFHDELRMIVKRLLKGRNVPNNFNFSEREMYEIGRESTEIQLDSFLFKENRKHYHMIYYVLKQNRLKPKFFEEISKMYAVIPLKKQLRKNGDFVDRSDRPIDLVCHIDSDEKIAISVIDFDASGYFNKELFCQNILIALNDFVNSNLSYKACLIITGNVSKTIINWIYTSVEIWQYSEINIKNVEILYAIPHSVSDVNTEIFYYPIRSIKNNSLRPIHKIKKIEDAWRYIDFPMLLDSTSNEVEKLKISFMIQLWKSFIAQIDCIYNPSRDNIDTECDAERLLEIAKSKFESYISRLLKSDSKREKAELIDILVNLKITESKKDSDRILGVEPSQKILEMCQEKFEILKSNLRKNIEIIRSGTKKQGGIPLDWGHLIQDTYVKQIDYSSTLNTLFTSEYLLDLLEVYSEEVPFYDIKTYIVFLAKEKKELLHIRGFNKKNKFNFSKSIDNRISSRETFYQARLENLLTNIFLIVMRSTFKESELNEFSEKIAAVICTNINIKNNKDFGLISSFLDQFSKDYLSDFSANHYLKYLFHEENIKNFLLKLRDSIKSRRKTITETHYPSLEEQYNIACETLVKLPLFNLGFSLLDVFTIIQKLSITEELPDSIDETSNIIKTLEIHLSSFNNIIKLLKSLSVFNNNTELDLQARNLYIKSFEYRKFLLCKFIYVIIDDTIIFAPESFFRSEGAFVKTNKTYNYSRPAHSQLAKGGAVQAAGECIFVKIYDKWCLRFITNGSGHYRPDAFKTLSKAEEVFRRELAQFKDSINFSKIILRNTITPNITFDPSSFLPHGGELLEEIMEPNVGPRFIEEWRLQDVEDKGNCFYLALVEQMKIINHSFLDVVPIGTSPHNSLRLRIQGRSFTDGEWADIPEIFEAVRQFRAVVAIIDTRRPDLGFHCYFLNGQGEVSETHNPDEIPTDRPIFRLAFTGNHYLSIQSHPSLNIGAIRKSFIDPWISFISSSTASSFWGRQMTTLYEKNKKTSSCIIS